MWWESRGTMYELRNGVKMAPELSGWEDYDLARMYIVMTFRMIRISFVALSSSSLIALLPVLLLLSSPSF